jgi:DNA integrity scanning protein DisA with diadenylate cyclase activity
MTPEEEREAVTEIALQDHGGYLGGFAQEGGLQVDPAESEAMRDRALAQYLQRKEEFDRFREREAQRLAEQQAQEADEEDDADAVGDAALGEPDAAAVDVEERLSEVPGLGPAKMNALLQEFGSLEDLEQADEDDLVQVTGIGQQLAKGIVRALR